MKKISILCLLLCCTTVKAVDSVNSTLHQKLEMVMKKGNKHAKTVQRIKKDFPEKFQKIESNLDSLTFLVDQEHVISNFDRIMGQFTDAALDKFADFLLEPQFRDNIDNILTVAQQQKKETVAQQQKNDKNPAVDSSLDFYELRGIVSALGGIVIRTGSVDCLTDATLPVVFHHSSEARYLWGGLNNTNRQILCTGYESNRVLSKDFSYGADGVPFDEFIKTWDTGLKAPGGPFEGKNINLKDPKHRKIINEYFHENFSSRED